MYEVKRYKLNPEEADSIIQIIGNYKLSDCKYLLIYANKWECYKSINSAITMQSMIGESILIELEDGKPSYYIKTG